MNLSGECKIYCVVVTYNGSDWIRYALDSVYASTVSICPIVIDNHSSDGTVAIISNEYPDAILLPQSSNLGFGLANNVGLQLALEKGADYILLLNQDAAIDENMLATMLPVFSEFDEFGILTPLQLTWDGAAVDSSFLSHAKRSGGSMISDLFVSKLNAVYELGGAPAAVWLLTREAVLSVGGFDPVFFLYGEDDDFVSRLQFKGLKVGVVLSARARHAHSYTELICMPFFKKRRIMFGYFAQRAKHPTWRLWRRLFETFKCFDQLVRLAMKTRDWKSFLAIFSGLGEVFFKTVMLHKHRKICMVSKSPWIS